MRKARIGSNTNIYHVMMRGNNHQLIFRDNHDKMYFLSRIEKYLKELKLELYAWCLMDNHFHLIIKATKKSLAVFIKKICCSYVPYFNRKYERSGHLFQDRYKSEPIETDSYFLGAIRYIHNNPEKAGMCKASSYKWSSYREYAYKAWITNTNTLLSLIGGVENFNKYSQLEDDNKYLDDKVRIWDKKALKIIKRILKLNNVINPQNVSNELKEKIIKKLILEGLSLYQISRLLNISVKHCSYLKTS